MPRNTLGASAILVTVALTVLRRNAHLVLIFSVALVLRKDATALGVAFVIILWVFARALMGTMVTGANTRLFSVKRFVSECPELGYYPVVQGTDRLFGWSFY